MVKENFRGLTGEKSTPVTSDLATFESQPWAKFADDAKIPTGQHFIVGKLDFMYKKHAVLSPDVWIQNYRPHSDPTSGYYYSPRKYDKIWSSTERMKSGRIEQFYPEKMQHDLCLVESNLYFMKNQGEFVLDALNCEWQQEGKDFEFLQRICDLRDFEILSDEGAQKRIFCCEENLGYFLKGRKYEVSCILVGKTKDFAGYQKLILFCDFETGIPSIVDFSQKERFIKI